MIARVAPPKRQHGLRREPNDCTSSPTQLLEVLVNILGARERRCDLRGVAHRWHAAVEDPN